ncbi:MAG: F0F1 ATP synthase subunit gamma [Planctomycetes bacterium]|nr:F0F1 ATP synthase subunit gamma [Planctomycetota bacterium]
MRIKSVTSTQKITKAMKMVAASKLRRAQERAEAARPYAERMERMVGAIAETVAGAENAPRLLVGTGHADTHRLVVTTSDRGLCGGFNGAVARLARARIAELAEDGKTVKLLCLGRKGRDLLRRDFGDRIVELTAFHRVANQVFELPCVHWNVPEQVHFSSFQVIRGRTARARKHPAQIPWPPDPCAVFQKQTFFGR